MSRSLLVDPFAHPCGRRCGWWYVPHAQVKEQLGKESRRIYGSVLETMRHLVGADSSYLFALTVRRRVPVIDEDRRGLCASFGARGGQRSRVGVAGGGGP